MSIVLGDNGTGGDATEATGDMARKLLSTSLDTSGIVLAGFDVT